MINIATKTCFLIAADKFNKRTGVCGKLSRMEGGGIVEEGFLYLVSSEVFCEI